MSKKESLIEVEIEATEDAKDVTVTFKSDDPLGFDDLISALKKVCKQEYEADSKMKKGALIN